MRLALIRSGHLLTESDDDIGNALTTYYREEGITVLTHTTLRRVEVRDGKKVVHIHADGADGELGPLGADFLWNLTFGVESARVAHYS